MASFKFAEKAGVPILPVSISGSYRLYEETGSFKRSPQLIKIHPLVDYGSLERKDRTSCQLDIIETIKGGIEDI